jgi:hypothetical protein
MIAGHAVQVGNGTIATLCINSATGCAAGVTVVTYYLHNTSFLQVVGVPTAAERSVATSIYTPIFTQSDQNLAHYAIAACINNRQLQPGDDVIIRSQQWRNTFTGCNLQTSGVSNDFKGWYHDPKTTSPGTSIPSPPPAGGCTQANCGLPTPAPTSFTTTGAKTSYTEFDYFEMKGGNSIGQEQANGDIAIIHASWLSCHGGQPPCRPMLIPVIDYFAGNGSFDVHIAFFAAVVPDQDWGTSGPGPSQDWTATIVPNGIVDHRPDWTGCSSGCPPITPTTAFAISLFH